MTIEIRPEPYDAPAAAALVAAVQREYVSRYGGPDATPVDPADFSPPLGHFLVVYLDGEPVACGGWRVHGAAADRQRAGRSAPLRPLAAGSDAEIKRMYVVPSARGRGLSRVMLAALEASAAAAGLRRTILETGSRQPEAIALYESSGYTRIPGFGVYADAPGSRCYAKNVTAGAKDVTAGAEAAG